jgi:diadenosine tetraphosphate (Ap4A) HIT family hydrolase
LIFILLKSQFEIRQVYILSILYLEKQVLFLTQLEMNERKKILRVINEAKEVLYAKEERLFDLKYVCRSMEAKKVEKEIELEQIERKIITLRTNSDKSVRDILY